ncbi:MAG: sialate O-acetylesterase [Planctomycetota bacterium]|jgi:sialate O-acetylesterase
MKANGIGLILSFLWMMISTAAAKADVELPHIFGNNMVLQRDRPVRFWGKADPGEDIRVRLGEHEAGTAADAGGRWSVELPVMKNGGPHQVIIRGKNTICFENVLVGEVWLCSGEGNMEFPFQWVVNARKEIETARIPEIRLFQVPKIASGRPEADVPSSWQVCSPQHVFNFSAVAYFFGRSLYEKLGVPVGVIQSTWESTPIEAWIPPAGFNSVAKMSHMINKLGEAESNYRESLARHLPAFRTWLIMTREALAKGRSLAQAPHCPRHPFESHQAPTGVYNGMIHPIRLFAIRGVVWYQGERNLGDGMWYHEKMKALIRGWRASWAQDDLPFCFVQLTPYCYGRHRPTEKPAVDPDPYRLPEIREAQTATLGMPNTGMVVTTDIGDLNTPFPRNKQEVGRRLALWALARIYGHDSLVYSGPLFKSMSVEKGRLRLHFHHADGGLMTRDGAAPTGFEIAGRDMKFVEANGCIEGGTVLVWSDAVAEPAAIRFGWHQEAQPNLMNKGRLPASPFRSSLSDKSDERDSI